MTATQETPLDHLTLVATGAYTCSTTEQFIFAYLKNLMSEVWLPVSLNPSTEILPFVTLTRLGTSSTTGGYKKYNSLLGEAQNFERQARTESGLNDKFHVLPETISLRLVVVDVSSQV